SPVSIGLRNRLPTLVGDLAQKPFLLRRRGALREEVRTPLLGSPERLLETPAPDRTVVAARQDCRNILALERWRLRVLGILQKACRERFLGDGRRLDRTRQEPDDRVDDDQCAKLAAGEDVVADRQLEIDQRSDSLIEALVARADEDQMATSSEVAGALLPKSL